MKTGEQAGVAGQCFFLLDRQLLAAGSGLLSRHAGDFHDAQSQRRTDLLQPREREGLLGKDAFDRRFAQADGAAARSR